MNELVTDIKSLEIETLKNLKNSKAANTLRAYQSDFKDFSSFCAKNGLNSMPTEPKILSIYLTHLSSGNVIFGLPIFERLPFPFSTTLNTVGEPSSIFEFERDELRVNLPTAPVKFCGILLRDDTSIFIGSETSNLARVL